MGAGGGHRAAGCLTPNGVRLRAAASEHPSPTAGDRAGHGIPSPRASPGARLGRRTPRRGLLGHPAVLLCEPPGAASCPHRLSQPHDKSLPASSHCKASGL